MYELGKATKPQQWRYLAATQKLTLRGAGIIASCVALASFLGVARVSDKQVLNPFSGSVSLAGLRFAPETQRTLDSSVTESISAEMQRAIALVDFSARFSVSADLAALIYDIAVEEEIDPELAFRIVYVESRFDPRAISSAGALGLAQVMPGTAQIFDPDLVSEDLFNSEINLRIGLRHFSNLMHRYNGDLSLALLAYNRGGGRVKQLLEAGRDPRNGYASAVLEGYSPRGG